MLVFNVILGVTLCVLFTEASGQSYRLSERLTTTADSGDLKNIEVVIQQPTETAVDENFKDQGVETALVEAVRGPAPNLDEIKLLLDKGAKVSARNKRGETALMVALGVDGSFDVVRLLVEKGTDVNACDNDGVTALMRVVDPILRGSSESMQGEWNSKSSGWTETFRNAKFKYGSRALIDNDSNEVSEIIQLLLAKGAAANVQDKHGRTALTRVLEPIIEIDADTLILESGDRGTFPTIRVQNGTVRVKRDTPDEIVQLLRARDAKE